MDLLLSIPVAASLLTPSPPSWTTALNLVFFYLTWSALVLCHSPLKVHLAGVVAIRAGLWLAPSLLTLLVDVALPSLVHSIKHGGRGSLPPRTPRALARLVLLVLFNLALMVAAEGAASIALAAAFKRPAFQTSTALPPLRHMLVHLAVLLAARETLAYYIHRFVLHGATALARPHRRYAHAVPAAPFSLQLLTDHPVALLLHRLVPVYLPAVVLRPHLLTYFALVAVCTAEETLTMSGYTVIPGVVASRAVRRCAVHYAGRGATNFGAWGILDWVHGTGRGRAVLDDVTREAERRYVKERPIAAARGPNLVQRYQDAVRGGAKSRKTDRTRAKQ